MSDTPTATTTPEPTPPPAAAKKKDAKPPIVWKFKPVNPGEFLMGIPQRDLTQADVDQLSVEQRRDALIPGPSGKPMYVAVDPPKE